MPVLRLLIIVDVDLRFSCPNVIIMFASGALFVEKKTVWKRKQWFDGL